MPTAYGTHLNRRGLLFTKQVDPGMAIHGTRGRWTAVRADTGPRLKLDTIIFRDKGNLGKPARAGSALHI